MNSQVHGGTRDVHGSSGAGTGAGRTRLGSEPNSGFETKCHGPQTPGQETHSGSGRGLGRDLQVVLQAGPLGS